MKLAVHLPAGRWQEEKRYVAQCVFGEFLGLPLDILAPRSEDWMVTAGGAQASWPNLFFPEDDPEQYLDPGRLPSAPLRRMNPSELGFEQNESSVPIFWGRPTLRSTGDADWLGTIFFLLTRFEETLLSGRDEHGRFPASRSILYRDNLLDRPLVDEYVEILWAELKKKFPSLNRPQRAFRFFLSHDVDVPTQWVRGGLPLLAKRLAGDLLKRRSWRKAGRRLAGYLNPAKDEVNCFDWIMRESERRGIQSRFYFVAENTHPLDPGYDVRHPFYRGLIREILARGHEVGLHGSYLSMLEPERFSRETATLFEVAGNPITYARQHFLRFQAPETWRGMEAAGITHDSSLGFAEKAGFRCGTCQEFPVFDVKAGKPLAIREQPLIVMEHTLLSNQYEGNAPQAAYDRISRLAHQARKYGGQFTLLWHNHNLVSQDQRDLYLKTLDLCCGINR